MVTLRALSFVFVLCLAACTGKKSTLADQTLARVNGEPLALSEFLIPFQQLKGEQDEISQKNPKLIDQLKQRALNEVVIIALLRQEANKRKLRIAREEVEGRLANWKDGYPPGGFEEMLRKRNTSEDYLRKRIEDQLLIEKITVELFDAETRVSDEEMKAYFKIHESEFVRPERVHALQIVVPTLEEADKLRQEISAGKTTFESAARQYSLSPDAAKGGDLGFFSRNEKIAAFNEAFVVPVGSLSKPIQSRYGVHLLKVVEKQPSKRLSFNEARPDILKAIKRTKEVRVYKEWVTKLLKDGEIYRNDALFNRIS